MGISNDMEKHVKSGLKIDCNIPGERDEGRKGQRKKGAKEERDKGRKGQRKKGTKEESAKEERGKSYRLLEAKLSGRLLCLIMRPTLCIKFTDF